MILRDLFESSMKRVLDTMREIKTLSDDEFYQVHDMSKRQWVRAYWPVIQSVASNDAEITKYIPASDSHLFHEDQSQEKYILYFNDKPVATYSSEDEAEYQGRSIAKKIPDTEVKVKRETCTLTPVQLEENLRKWFKEKWVRFGPDGKIRGDCARGSSKEGKPKCLPQSKAQALGKKGRAASAAKKRREDPNPERRGAAKNVATKVREGAIKNLHTELAEKYHELAPTIEKYKDSFLAGQLYDALEAIAMEHGAEQEFRRMITGARNRAHMDYDTNPGGFENWFWYLPFAEEQLDELDKSTLASYVKKAAPDRYNRIPNDLMQMKDAEKNRRQWVTRDKGIDQALNKLSKESVAEENQDDRNARIIAGEIEDAMSQGNEKLAQEKIKQLIRVGYTLDKQGRLQRMGMYEESELQEKQDACYRKVKSRYKVWPSAYASGALVQCRKKGVANWGTGGKKK